jgi:hypothetical protein
MLITEKSALLEGTTKTFDASASVFDGLLASTMLSVERVRFLSGCLVGRVYRYSRWRVVINIICLLI